MGKLYSPWEPCACQRPADPAAPARPPPLLQIKDVNRGAFGFVVLALDTLTGENVALKHIERGPQARQQRWRGSGPRGTVPTGCLPPAAAASNTAELILPSFLLLLLPPTLPLP